MTPKKLGRYEIIEECGRGAMGVVYKALDPKIQRHVALKVIRWDRNPAGREPFELFEKELRIAGKLSHPQIVRIYDAGEWEGTAFYAMEYVEGKSLAERLQEQGPLPCEDALQIMDQVAGALSFAHNENIIHRDIKTQNILLDQKGRAKVTDFGIARLASQAMTHPGSLVGTPHYSSPEQIQGIAVDARSDIFSLGVVIYEALTGANPFSGETMAETLGKIQTLTPPPPSSLIRDIPPEVDRLVLKALAKEPSKRYQGADEIRRDIERVVKRASESTFTVPGSFEQHDKERPFPGKRFPRLVLGLIAPLILAGAFLLYRYGPFPNTYETRQAGLYHQGYSELFQGHNDEAGRLFNRLLAMGRQKDKGLEGLAMLSLRQGEEDKALELSKQAVQANPENMYAHALQGEVHFRRGELDLAMEFYRQAERLTSEVKWQQAGVRNMMGRILSAEGRKEEALAYYQEAIEQDPTFRPAYDNLGSLLGSMGRSGESIKVLEELLSLDPGNEKALALVKQQKQYLGFRENKEKLDWLRKWVREFDREIKETGAVKPSIKGHGVEKPWSSRPLTVAFYDIEEKGTPPEREGETLFLQLGILEGLRESGRVSIVDREKFELLLNELQLSRTELVDPSRALAIGRVIGAETVVTGVAARYREELQVVFKGIEVETTYLKITLSGEKGRPETIPEFSNRIARELLKKITRSYPLKGIVKKVDGERVWMDIGRSVGVKPGLRFRVLGPEGEKVSTVPGAREEKGGILEVLDVMETASLARILDPDMRPRIGDRIIEDPGEERET